MIEDTSQVVPHEIRRSTSQWPRPVGVAAGGGKFLRLQRLCFWLLRKLGASEIADRETYERVLIDKPKVTDIILRQQQNVSGLLHGRGPKFVIIGPRDLDEAIHSSNILEGVRVDRPFQFTFNAKTNIRQPNASGAMTIYGLQVIVVPWMDGCVVLPDLQVLAPDTATGRFR